MNSSTNLMLTYRLSIFSFNKLKISINPNLARGGGYNAHFTFFIENHNTL